MHTDLVTAQKPYDSIVESPAAGKVDYGSQKSAENDLRDDAVVAFECPQMLLGFCLIVFSRAVWPFSTFTAVRRT